MSVIVGFQQDGSVTIGADSAYSSGEGESAFVFPLPQGPKVWEQGPYLIGGCGSPRALQLLRHTAELPDPPAQGDLGRFLVAEIVPILRQVMGAAEVHGAQQGAPMGRTSLLLGLRGELWEIAADLTVMDPGVYGAIGFGFRPAFGALLGITKLGVSGPRAVEIALEVAAATTPSVCPPFRILTSTQRPNLRDGERPPPELPAMA